MQKQYFSETEQPSCSVGRRSAGRRSQVTLRARCLLEQRPARSPIAWPRELATTKRSKRPRESAEARPATSTSVPSDLDNQRPRPPEAPATSDLDK
ncbi:UNVERIFIED_CONTAM: hypothetical protein Sradi_7080700 [Sesamum radiatum]|uniref:Uncharacterized protein n=1 Tax=Sesamum radiatum TaxID=300843 RepID=A0AAW2J3T8_SESRA